MEGGRIHTTERLDLPRNSLNREQITPSTYSSPVDRVVTKSTSFVRFSRQSRGRSVDSTLTEDIPSQAANPNPFRSRYMSSPTDIRRGREYIVMRVGCATVQMKNMIVERVRSSLPTAALRNRANQPKPMTAEALAFGLVLCPCCREPVMLVKKTQIGRLNWLVALGVCFMGGCLGCFLIPFCMDELKDETHVCPNCRAVLGVFKQLEFDV